MTTAPHNPPFRAEHIGSLLRPPELLQARAEHKAGRLSAAELHKLEDALIRQAIAWTLGAVDGRVQASRKKTF